MVVFDRACVPASVDPLTTAALSLLTAHPRIALSRAAQIVGCSTPTLIKHIEQLKQQRRIVFSAQPLPRLGHSLSAFLDIDVTPGRQRAVIEALQRHPRVVQLDSAGHGRDLIATLIAPSMAEMCEDVVPNIRQIPHITRTELALITTYHRIGRHSQQFGLTQSQRTAYEHYLLHYHPKIPEYSGYLTTHDYSVLRQLVADCRLSANDVILDDHHGHSISSRQRALARVIGNPNVLLRTFYSPDLLDSPIRINCYARLPERHAPLIRLLLNNPALRTVLQLTGPANLALSAQLKSVGQIPAFIKSLEDAVPALEIRDVWPVIRTYKQWGWILDDDEHFTSTYIDIDLPSWSGHEENRWR